MTEVTTSSATVSAKSSVTPGSWTAISRSSIFNGCPYIAAEDGHGLILACVHHSGHGNYEHQLGDPMADATLMAASPKLIEVCERQIENWQMLLSGEWNGSEEGIHDAIDDLQTVIDEARGKAT